MHTFWLLPCFPSTAVRLQNVIMAAKCNTNGKCNNHGDSKCNKTFNIKWIYHSTQNVILYSFDYEPSLELVLTSNNRPFCIHVIRAHPLIKASLVVDKPATKKRQASFQLKRATGKRAEQPPERRIASYRARTLWITLLAPSRWPTLLVTNAINSHLADISLLKVSW